MVGRVCCDSEGRLNENSILLEGSIKFSQASWDQRSRVGQVAQIESPPAAEIVAVMPREAGCAWTCLVWRRIASFQVRS